MYRISCHTLQFKNRSIYDILTAMKEVGFDTYDFTMCNNDGCYDQFIDKRDYIKRAKTLRKFADKLGMKCNQTHSPFPIEHPSFSKAKIQSQYKLLIRSLKVSSILGADYCVVHPLNDYDDEYNSAYFKKILPFCRRFHIKVSIENMWNWDEKNDHACLASCSNHKNFVHLLDLINDDFACAIVDIGHAEMKGLNTSAVEMINSLGPRLKCLHIHDNDKHHDQHLLPGDGMIDFGEIIKALKKINYQGDFTFETIPLLNVESMDEFKKQLKRIYVCGLKLRKDFLS